MVTDVELARIVATSNAFADQAASLERLTAAARARSQIYSAAAHLAGSPAGHQWTAGRGLERPAALDRVAVTCNQVARQLLDHADRNDIILLGHETLQHTLTVGGAQLATGAPAADPAAHGSGVAWFTTPMVLATGPAPSGLVWRRTSPVAIAAALVGDTTLETDGLGDLPRYVALRLVTLEPGSAAGSGLDGWTRQLLAGLLTDNHSTCSRPVVAVDHAC